MEKEVIENPELGEEKKAKQSESLLAKLFGKLISKLLEVLEKLAMKLLNWFSNEEPPPIKWILKWLFAPILFLVVAVLVYILVIVFSFFLILEMIFSPIRWIWTLVNEPIKWILKWFFTLIIWIFNGFLALINWFLNWISKGLDYFEHWLVEHRTKKFFFLFIFWILKSFFVPIIVPFRWIADKMNRFENWLREGHSRESFLFLGFDTFFIWSLRFAKWFFAIIAALVLSSLFYWFNRAEPKWLQWASSFLQTIRSENFWTDGWWGTLGVVFLIFFVINMIVLMTIFLESFGRPSQMKEKLLELPFYFLLFWCLYAFSKMLVSIPQPYVLLTWLTLITVGSMVNFFKMLRVEKEWAQSFPGKKLPIRAIKIDDKYTQWKLSKGETKLKHSEVKTIIRRKSDGFVSDLNILWEARESAAYYENDDERLHEIRSRKMMEVLEKILDELKELKAPRKKSSPGKRGDKS